MSKTERKIKELEDRIQQLEARPLFVPTYVQYTWPYPQPYMPWPAYPYWYTSTTSGAIGSSFSTTTGVSNPNITLTAGGTNASNDNQT